MTNEEKALVIQCGTFCHVTTQEIAEVVAESGLDPSNDTSAVVRGPKHPNAIYFCPEAKLDTALTFLGDRAKSNNQLFVIKIAAAVLADKDCGPDIGWLSAYLPVEEIATATIAISLAIVGAIACYEIITPAEFIEIVAVQNPRFDPEAVELI